MAPQKPQLGTLVVKGQTKKTTYPVHRADFGVLKYTDTSEIWFDVAAGKAIAGTTPSKDDESTPHMDAAVYADEKDVSNLSNRKFAIPAPSDALERPCPEAHLYDTEEYSDPDRLGPGTIRIGEQRAGVYSIHWKATLDYYSGARPDEEIEIEVKADFTLRGVKEVPCSVSYTSNRPFVRWMFLLLPLCGTAGYIASQYTTWLNWWGGILVGFLVATYIAQKIDSRWQRRVHELKFDSPAARRAVTDDAGEEE